MRILVVSQRYFPERFSVTDICEYFAREGNQVTVITGLPCYGKDHIYEGYEKCGTFIHNGVIIIRLRQKPRKKDLLSLVFSNLSFYRSSRHFVKSFSEKFDIVFSLCLSPITSVSAANLLAKKEKIPNIHYCLDLWPESVVAVKKISKKFLFYHFLFKMSRSIYSKMDVIMVSSPSFISYFKNVLHLPNIKTIFIPQPSLVELPEGNEEGNAAISNSFVYAGNVGSLQLVENMILGFSMLDKKLNFTFKIFGSGSRLDSVLNLIKKTGLEDRIFYGGVLDSRGISLQLASASFLVLGLENDGTAVSNTIPNKLVTYLAYGKPIVASLCGDGKNIAQEAGGVIFSGSEPADFSKAFIKAMNLSSEERRKMGENNSAYFGKTFNFGHLCDEMLTLFKDEADHFSLEGMKK